VRLAAFHWVILVVELDGEGEHEEGVADSRARATTNHRHPVADAVAVSDDEGPGVSVLGECYSDAAAVARGFVVVGAEVTDSRLQTLRPEWGFEEAAG
jgi:hypothetical protein